MSFKKEIKKFDEKLKNFYSNISKKEKVNIMFLGDHGMADIHEYINIEELISSFSKENGLERGQDYLYFLDSTMARFWFFGEKRDNYIESFYDYLNHVSCGEFLKNSKNSFISPWGRSMEI